MCCVHLQDGVESRVKDDVHRLYQDNEQKHKDHPSKNRYRGRDL